MKPVTYVGECLHYVVNHSCWCVACGTFNSLATSLQKLGVLSREVLTISHQWIHNWLWRRRHQAWIKLQKLGVQDFELVLLKRLAIILTGWVFALKLVNGEVLYFLFPFLD